MGQPAEAVVGPGAALLRLMGLWQSPSRLVRFLRPLLASLTLGSNALMVVGAALKLCLDPPQELEQITLCGLVTSLCTGFFLKAALFVIQGDTLRQTVQLVEDIRARFCDGNHNEATRRRYQAMSVTVYHYSQAVAVSAIVGWSLGPLFTRAFTSDDHQQQHRQLPAPVWVPDSCYESPMYEFLYLVNAFCALATSESCLVVDIFFLHMLLMVAAELEVLNDNISAMGLKNLQALRSEKEGFIISYKTNDGQLAVPNGDLGEQAEEAAHEWLHRQLVKNVLHHREILRSVSLLQSAMDVSIFSLLFINMANLCSSLFVAAVLLQRDGNIGKAANALCSIPGILYETVAFSIYSQIVTDQSERLMQSAFSCGWVNSDARFKRSLMIFMTVTERPVAITVGKMCTLSKQMLIQVLNGTYGLLNMLYYMYGSN